MEPLHFFTNGVKFLAREFPTNTVVFSNECSVSAGVLPDMGNVSLTGQHPEQKDHELR